MPGPSRYDFVDALRGWAAVGVVAVHASHAAPPPDLTSLAHAGRFGVQLFFVASAYTLALSHDRRRDESAPLRNFFLRRAFRIAPLFLVGVAFYAAFGWDRGPWAPHGIGWPHVAATASFVHGWHPETINSVVPGGWSIAVEAWFYLCVPFVAGRLRTVPSALAAVAGTLAAAVACNAGALRYASAAYGGPPGLFRDFLYLWLPNQLPVFAAGFLAYAATRTDAPAGRGRSLGLMAAAAGLAGLSLARFGGDFPQHVGFAGAFALLLLGLRDHPWRPLVNRAIRHVGTVSYSVYLWHFAVLGLLTRTGLFTGGESWTTFAGLLATTLVVSVAVATISHRLIERPMIDAGNRLIANLDRTRERVVPERSESVSSPSHD